MYVGRFAPTVSGPLHLGSLFTAIASYLDARANNGRWQLRFDDVDAPRVVAGTEDELLTTISAHGLEWDGNPSKQSDYMSSYEQAVAKLRDAGHTFYCTCTRRELRRSPYYNGRCRQVVEPPDQPAAIRMRTDLEERAFSDNVQGNVRRDLRAIGGDFVIWRKEGIPAYPLAVIVDDINDGVTHVVRGADLIDNTLQQVFLAAKLGVESPHYAHVPILNERDGIKLSKRLGAAKISQRFALQNVRTVLQLFGLEPPPHEPPRTLLQWAVEHWSWRLFKAETAITSYICLT